MRADPTRLTSYICRVFTVGCVAVRIAQALGLSLNPTQDREQGQDPRATALVNPAKVAT